MTEMYTKGSWKNNTQETSPQAPTGEKQLGTFLVEVASVRSKIDEPLAKGQYQGQLASSRVIMFNIMKVIEGTKAGKDKIYDTIYIKHPNPYVARKCLERFDDLIAYTTGKNEIDIENDLINKSVIMTVKLNAKGFEEKSYSKAPKQAELTELNNDDVPF